MDMFVPATKTEIAVKNMTADSVYEAGIPNATNVINSVTDAGLTSSINTWDSLN
jgi:hypothetical protein